MPGKFTIRSTFVCIKRQKNVSNCSINLEEQNSSLRAIVHVYTSIPVCRIFEQYRSVSVREGPYGGSKEPSPVSGVPPACFVILKEDVLPPQSTEGVGGSGANMERETAIINRPG